MSKSKPVGSAVGTSMLTSTVHQQQLTPDENTVFRSIVGSSMYLETHTRPYLSVIDSMLNSHLESLREAHMLMAKRALQYLRDTSGRKLVLKPGSHTQLGADVDASWGIEKEQNRRSRSEILIIYGNWVVHSSIHLQKSVSLSSAEAEYIDLSDAGRMIIWLRCLLQESRTKQQSTKVFQDNSGSIE